jgi:succinate dehydrogenase / fumarate reductase flavoprotein subunit
VRAAAADALAPFSVEGGENPYTIQHDLQDTMQRLVGIIRTETELAESLDELKALKERARSMVVEGHRQYNPGWHLAIDLRNMLLVSECIATAALERQESRGGHTRDDFPGPDPAWGSKNLILTLDGESEVVLRHQPLPQMPDELRDLLDV